MFLKFKNIFRFNNNKKIDLAIRKKNLKKNVLIFIIYSDL